MPGQFTPITTYVDGQILTAALLNGSIVDLRDHLEPGYIDDASVNLSAFQATTDPGELTTESLPSTQTGELQRLRFAIAETKTAIDPSITRWYETPFGYQVYSVKAYGAVGNGSVDDASAFTSALSAANSAGGGVVFVPTPSSYYKIGSQLTIPNNTRVIGVHKRTTKIQKAFNGDLFVMGDGASFENLYIEGDGDNFAGKGLTFTSTNGRQFISHCKIVNFRGACLDFATAAGSQSSFFDIEMNCWDNTTHAAAATGSGLYAVVISSTQQLSAVPRIFDHIETNGSPGFNFGGSNDTYLSNAFVGDLSFEAESRGVHLSNVRWANQTTVTILGHNNTVIGCGIAPQITIGSGSDDWHFSGNSLNNPPIIDNSANNRNMFDHNPIAYTPTWTASSGSAPALGNGTIRGQYSQIGSLIMVSVQLTFGTTTTGGSAGSWRFSLPRTYLQNNLLDSGGSSAGAVLAQTGNGYIHQQASNDQRVIVPAVTSGTAYAVLNQDATGQLNYNTPWAWTTSDFLYFSLMYECQ